MRLTTRLAPLSLAIAVLALGACSQQPTRDDRSSSDPAPRSAPVRPVAPEAAPTPPAASAPTAPRGSDVPPADIADAQFTGIEACDEYLATYKACHTVLGIVSADQIDERLANLRGTWQERARDPANRDALEAQCQSIASEMETALDGRDCELPESDFVEPADDATFDNVEGDINTD